MKINFAAHYYFFYFRLVHLALMVVATPVLLTCQTVVQLFTPVNY
jgi:hypothetical protein